ncbi:MAG: ComEC/Rec2 family competence protein [Planctomycetales bacterium]|nr:ComEC/Rec2 family competence protein [Planctomycetales bacterium]
MQAARSNIVAAGMPYRPLLLIAAAVSLGIVSDRYVGSAMAGGLYYWWTAGVLFVLICCFLRHSGFDRTAAGTLLLASLCAGGAWHHLRWNYFAVDELARFASETEQPVCVEAIAAGQSKQSPAPASNPLRALPAVPLSETVVRVLRIRDGTNWRKVSGTCKLRVASNQTQLSAGDRLRVFARFGLLQPALNPGEYDWALAERGAGRYCDLFCTEPECVSVIERAAISPFGRWIGNVASRCEEQLAHYVGPDHSDLAAAVLLGARERLDDGVMDAFFETGTIHFLVVSGLHVGILALMVWILLQVAAVPRRWAILLTGILVIAYALLAGGRPPVVRTTVLVLLGLVSLVVGRVPSVKVVLAAAALTILAYNPSELFRGGTQLSFLCVAALAAFGHLADKRRPTDPLSRLIRKMEPWRLKAIRWVGRSFADLFVASLVVWVVAAPLVAYHFHITSPVGILISPFTWPLIAGALVSGLGICTIGWLLPPIASLLGIVCSWCLGATEGLVGLAQQSDMGHAYVAGPAVWWLIVLYGAMGVVAIVPRLQLGWKPLMSCAALWVAVGFAIAATDVDRERLRCTFLAMGHGTCVVLELPGGQTVLYDAGSLGSPERASQTIASYLWSQGISRLDAVVLSHADVDHYNAVPGLLDRFNLGVVYVSPLMFDPWATDGQLNAPEYLRATLQEADVALREIWMNDRLQVAAAGLEIEVLHPPRQGVAGRDNANSVLLHIRYAGHSILLPGDLESPGIEAVMAERPLDCDILLAPHHGSSNSDPPGFAAWCSPEWVVVSGHQIDRSSLTDVSYRRAGAKLMQTAELGAVQFVIDEQGVGVSSHRRGRVR